MKKIKLNQKLNLSKTTISKLTNDGMNSIYGGATETSGYGMCINNATKKCDSFSVKSDCGPMPIGGGSKVTGGVH